MIGLHALAAAYKVDTADHEGFELEPHRLRDALVVVMAATREDLRIMIARLDGPRGCANLYRGELNAAWYALATVERDMQALLPRKVIETTGCAVESVRPLAASLRRFA